MSRILQEKHEVRPDPVDNSLGNTWLSDRSARTKKGTPGREGLPGGDWESKTMNNAVFYESLPPGADITDQEMADARKMRTITAGTDDVTDNPSGSDFVKGFVRVKMRPTDDLYTNEHADLFYSEVEVDGNVGFCERANLLDRS